MVASCAADHVGELDGLVLLAAYSTRDLNGSGLAVLSVDDGCHAGFGRCGAQDGDGTPAISSDEQINRTAMEIVRLILTAS